MAHKAAPDRRVAELKRENKALKREVAALRRENSELRRRLEEMERQSRRDKRQATPFARRKLVEVRRKPGRAAGHPASWQSVPDHVDEEVFAPLPCCPHCQGGVADVEEVEQFVVDLPEVRPHVKRIVTQRGWCSHCRRGVRSSHPDQVSQAGGAAKVSLGPRAQGLAAELKHRLGVPYRKITDLFATYFGLKVTHAALVHASVRLGKAGEPTYCALALAARQSVAVHTDDTGWRIDTRSAWLWVFATSRITVYVIAEGRGHDVVVGMLGENFAGVLVSDGLPALDRLDKLGYRRAQCLGHLIRRAAEMAVEQKRGAVRFPRAVKLLLQRAVRLTDQRDQLPASTLERRARAIERRMDKLLAGRIDHPENLKLWNHLLSHRDQLLVCLREPAVAPTNNLAEQELRGAVVTRKIGGCNRTMTHAKAHAVLASVARTGHRNGVTLTEFLRDWLRPHTGPPPEPTTLPAFQRLGLPDPAVTR